MVRNHLLSAFVIVSFVTLAYARVTTSYFCGYDDFLETRRAAFVDQFDVKNIFTTTHFESFKYRPLNRAATLVSYLISPNSALPFRLRNVAFHLLVCAGIYVLAGLLFESPASGYLAALLFAIHPLANQTVAAAIFTNTIASSIFLLSLILFELYLRREKTWLLILSAICSVVDVFFYEAAIVLPALIATLWAIDCLAKSRRPQARQIAVFAAINAVLFGSYLILRQQIVGSAHAGISSPGSIVKGLIEYGAALLLPVDTVLANSWFHVPLPPELLAGGVGKELVPVAAAAAFFCMVVIFRNRRAIAVRLDRMGWDSVLAVLTAMGFSILPLVVFTDHVSETYIYLPLAFFCVLLGRVLMLIETVAVRSILIGCLVFSFFAATVIRNERVFACGGEAKRITDALSLRAFRQGAWNIDVAKAQETNTLHFGVYNYHGLDTVGSADAGAGNYGLQGVQAAVQTANHNEGVRVRVHSRAEMNAKCQHVAANQACFLVGPEGQVTQF